MRRRVEGTSVPEDIISTRRLRRPKITTDHLGFRLLPSANDEHQYYLDVPEPPRAPEPYKISAASSSMARAHRRSSFVILAGTGEMGSRSAGGSPLHERTRSPISPSRTIHGRSSPFRPRGFKGPLPHAQSRPPSPPPIVPRRFVQSQSLSQGNSPRKQSLIPQFRGNSMAVRNKNQKTNDRDRWERRSGRRVTRIPRTSSLKAPTKRAIAEPTRITKSSIKTTVANKPVTTVIAEKKVNRSPTKIPIRQQSSGRFIQLPIVEKLEKSEVNLTTPSTSSDIQSISTISGNHESAVNIATSKENDTDQSEKFENNSGLVDLLKQSSGGSGTSSVVTATTATAVQPLRIDTPKIIPQDTAKNQSKEVIKNSSPEPVVTDIIPQNVPKNPSSNDETKPDPVKPTKVAAVESMNVEAVIETVKSNDKKDVQKPPEDKVKEEKLEIKSNHNLEPQRPSEKLPEGTPSVINPSITDPPTTEKIEPTPTNTSPRVESNNKLRNNGSETSLKSSNGISIGSVESVRSTDTGVSVNTVRGVSSAREKRGTHVVKKSQEIETLSGNVMSLENQQNGEPVVDRIVEVAEHPGDSSTSQQTTSKFQGFVRWKESLVKRIRDNWPTSAGNNKKMRFLGCRRLKKKPENPPAQQDVIVTQQRNICSRLKTSCCKSIRCSSKIAPVESTSCCRPEKSCGFLCKSRNWCRWPNCCSCLRRPERTRSIRAKHSLTSVAPPPLSEDQKSKIPDVLIEHNSVMRGAIPCLPVPLAWFCLVWNVLLPGTGTIWSGLFNLCLGQPRFAATASPKSRFGAFIVDIIVGISQLFTVLFCLVGWGWSIWWGVTMIRLARKWKRFKAAEAVNSDPEARDGVLPAPGVPTHSLRGIERAR